MLFFSGELLGKGPDAAPVFVFVIASRSVLFSDPLASPAPPRDEVSRLAIVAAEAALREARLAEAALRHSEEFSMQRRDFR